jgi:hypothetical protein
VRGLYRGLTPPLIGGAAETGVNYLVGAGRGFPGRDAPFLCFPLGCGCVDSLRGAQHRAAQHPQVYSRLISDLSDPSQPPGAPPSLRVVPVAGAGAGFALSFILGPTELLKCRLQTAGQHRAGPVACLKQLIAEEGPRGLTRGLGATMAREVGVWGGGCVLCCEM